MSIFSVGKEEQSLPGETHDLDAVLARISAGASERDAHPSFPEDPFVQLAPTGALAIPVPDPIGRQGRRASFAEEWRVLRAVAGADGSVSRILDGHFNGVERVSLLAPEPPALEGAGSHRRGGTPPRSVGRRPDSRRGRAGSARS